MKTVLFTRCIGVLAALFGIAGGSFAQYHNSYLNQHHLSILEAHYFDRENWKEGQIKQTAFKPFLVPVELQESLLEAGTDNWQRKKHSSLVMRKIRNEHLIEISEGDFDLRADPVFNLQFGREKGGTGNLYTNTRGYDFRGNIGEHVFFGSSFYESQSLFPRYIDSLVVERQSVPAMGRWKPFKVTGYDYAFATGYVGVAIDENIHFQFGHDRHFIGYGHRSLFLSDGSFAYPSLRSTIGFFKGKLQLTNVWSVLQSLDRVAANYNGKEALMQRKGGTFHYLNFQPAHWIALGIFEGTMWNLWDSVASPKPVPPGFFNPVPGGSSFYDHGITSQILGINYFISPLNKLVLYGQLGLNRFHKSASQQFGGKYLSAFGLKWLDLFVEYNFVPAGFYQGRTQIDLGSPVGYSEPYGHNGQPLGLNTGDDREEIIAGASYRFRDFFTSVRYHKWRQTTPQPPGFNASMVAGEMGYIINPKSNMQLTFGGILRESSHAPVSTDYLYLAFRTNLFRTYFDF